MSGEDKVKTLGLSWHQTLDKFTTANSKKSGALTDDISTRKVAAFVIPYMILLLEMWLHKLSWDDKLPTELLEK